MTISKKSIAFIIFDKMQLLDFAGPWDFFKRWATAYDGPQTLFSVSENEDNIVTCAYGQKLIANYSFSTVPHFDYLVIPGGIGTRDFSSTDNIVSFIASKAPHCEEVLCVCTGVRLASLAGLCEGKLLTTHHNSVQWLRERHGTDFVADKKVIQDGNLWTCAGVTSGMDLALAFIEHIADSDTAGKVQLDMEYVPTSKIYGDSKIWQDAPSYLSL